MAVFSELIKVVTWGSAQISTATGGGVDVSVETAVTPTSPGVMVNRLGVLVAMTVEAGSVVNVAVDGRAKVGVATLEGVQALIKTRPISRIGKIILFFIFTSLTIISLVMHVI